MPSTDRNELWIKLLHLLGRSDVSRWKADDSFHEAWNERTERMAGLVLPGKIVLEFGSGQGALTKYLPEGCTHIATDIVDRGPGSLVYDLNSRSAPALPKADVAFFSGVLEYVNDVPRSLVGIIENVEEVICSYAPTELNPERRRSHGWVNDYTSDQLIDVFASLGLSCAHQGQWKRQVLFRFVREMPPA
jgi:hypothetical protein